jgi:hypothetical protein
MAPIPTAPDLNPGPLADYFFICGIESSQVFDDKVVLNGSQTPAVGTTIEENEVLEVDSDTRPKSTELDPLPSPDTNSRRNRLSYEARKSIGSFIQVESGRQSVVPSNRSSATIKNIAQIGGPGFTEADFEIALRKFANDRESFLEEIQFSAGIIPQQSTKRPTKSRPKTQRIVSDDGPAPSRSGVGTLRRRISTMSSLKRQTSMVRQGMYSISNAAQHLLHVTSRCCSLMSLSNVDE